jgi:hypothetical protein
MNNPDSRQQSELVKVGHRNGAVFLRLIRKTSLGRTSTLAILTPAHADEIADQLRDCARRARKEPKWPRFKICK